MSLPTVRTPSPEPEQPRGPPLRWHDTHLAVCPACAKHLLFTDSASMIEEAKAAGIPDVPALSEPIETTFQGERTKIFPVACSCGTSYLSFIDIVNRERIEQVERDLLPYYPEIAEDKDLRKRYLEPKRRDVLLTKEEFARRVAREKNKFVREAIQRKCDERCLGVEWVRPKLVARLVTEPETQRR